jgi:hypothetical protein
VDGEVVVSRKLSVVDIETLFAASPYALRVTEENIFIGRTTPHLWFRAELIQRDSDLFGSHVGYGKTRGLAIRNLYKYYVRHLNGKPPEP